MLSPRLAALLAASLLAAPALAKDPYAKPAVACEMRFNLSGWSVFYRTASGQGTITCSNGQRATVALDVKGGGVTFGRSEVAGGHASFTPVRDIRDLYGSYAQAEAHAGATRSAGASVMTKGPVSMSLAGTGEGVDLGISFGRFKISPR
jgi:hypothetical protein